MHNTSWKKAQRGSVLDIRTDIYETKHRSFSATRLFVSLSLTTTMEEVVLKIGESVHRFTVPDANKIQFISTVTGLAYGAHADICAGGSSKKKKSKKRKGDVQSSSPRKAVKARRTGDSNRKRLTSVKFTDDEQDLKRIYEELRFQRITVSDSGHCRYVPQVIQWNGAYTL